MKSKWGEVTGLRPKLDPVLFPPDKLCDPGHNQTSAADYWTQPSVSSWAPSAKRSHQCCWWPWALCSWEAQFHRQTAKLGGRAEPRGRDWWENKDEHPIESATWKPRNDRTADQKHFVSARFGFAFPLLSQHNIHPQVSCFLSGAAAA